LEYLPGKGMPEAKGCRRLAQKRYRLFPHEKYLIIPSIKDSSAGFLTQKYPAYTLIKMRNRCGSGERVRMDTIERFFDIENLGQPFK
jgi:hypothetical protein